MRYLHATHTHPPVLTHTSTRSRELPELLGYAARPPTASKADIARAGLAVIGPAALPDAERAGRVLATCVERVSGVSLPVNEGVICSRPFSLVSNLFGRVR